MIKLIIFDLNKVLVDDLFFEKDSKLYDQELLKNLKINSAQLRKSYNKFSQEMGLGILQEDEFWRKVLKDSKAEKNIEFCKNFIRSIVFEIKGIKDLLAMLKRKIHLIILSGDSDYFTKFKIEKFRFNDFFEKIFSTAQIKLSKENPKIYEKICKEMKVNPKDCLFIDDLDKHLRVAENIGMKTIKFTNSEALINSLKNLKII